jgi:integrase
LFGHAEIRISLQTGYVREARHRALGLYVMLLKLIGGGVLDYQELRAKLAQWLADLLDEPDKKLISQKVIRERLNGYLRALLEKDELDVHPRKGVSGPGIELTAGQMSDCHANMLTHLVDSPESLVNIAVDCIPQLVKEGVFRPDEITAENILQIAKAYTKIQITNHKVLEARAKGDYLMEQAVFAAPYEPYPQKHDELGDRQEQDDFAKKDTLSDFIEKYVQTKLSDGAWKEHSVADHRVRLVNLVEILEDKSISDVSRDDMRYFRDVLRKLPPNRTKKKEYKGKSVKEILEMAPTTMLSVKTVNMIVEAASSMFDWGVREGLLTQNPAKSLSIKDDRQEISLRDAFSPEDIRKIFSSEMYVKGRFKHPSFFWTPLIGVYTGMRLEEVCQLDCDDIYESDAAGVWVIDINVKPSRDGNIHKLLKNKNSVRVIPIHRDLIQIGFLEYHGNLKKRGVERLFSELQKTDLSPKYGKQPGKSFGKLVRQLEIDGNKSFHSLRHAFSQFFKVRELHNDIFRQIFGHEIPGLAGRQYGSKFDTLVCYNEIVSKLDYGIDLGIINAKLYL